MRISTLCLVAFATGSIALPVPDAASVASIFKKDVASIFKRDVASIWKKDVAGVASIF
jgi:hypothetical protein